MDAFRGLVISTEGSWSLHSTEGNFIFEPQDGWLRDKEPLALVGWFFFTAVVGVWISFGDDVFLRMRKIITMEISSFGRKNVWNFWNPTKTSRVARSGIDDFFVDFGWMREWVVLPGYGLTSVSDAVDGMIQVLLLMVQKSGKNHLGCTKPCKSWVYTTYQLLQDFFHQLYVSYKLYVRFGRPVTS